jgi:hypothetical protein
MPVPFERLADAIEFLAASLDAGDVEAIADRCTNATHDVERAIPGDPGPREYRLRAIRLLGQRHSKKSLRLTYAGWTFPRKAVEFKLGGHAKELGHVHIDFVRDSGSWLLSEIWVCR